MGSGEPGGAVASEFDSVDLVEAIRAVRRQLKEASVSARDDDIQMDVDALELEFTVEVKRDLKAKGGVKAWVVNADAEAALARTGTHKVTISLKPRVKLTGESVAVGDDDLKPGGIEYPFD